MLIKEHLIKSLLRRLHGCRR